MKLKFRWKRVAILCAALGPIVAFPYWYQWIDSSFYSGVRCFVQKPDGELVKAAGDECYEKSILTLRVRDR
jgi:hypothetical protein